MDNRSTADRLDGFAAMLELVDANPYTLRAHRRAAETIRLAPLPIADLVRSGRARQPRGIGPSIEARLRELIEMGRSPSWRSSGASPSPVSPASAATSGERPTRDGIARALDDSTQAVDVAQRRSAT